MLQANILLRRTAVLPKSIWQRSAHPTAGFLACTSRLGASKADHPTSSVPLQTQLLGATNIGLGVGAFVTFDAGVRFVMVASGLDTMLPTQIGGMLGAFTCLSAANLLIPGPTATLHAALTPGVGWVNRWLPVFLMPVQVILPTIHLPGGIAEVASLSLLLAGGWVATLVVSARLVAFAQGAMPVAAVQASAAAASAPARTLRLPAAWLSLALLAGVAGVTLEESSDECWVARSSSLAALGVGSYSLAMWGGIPGHISLVVAAGATMSGAAALAAVRGESFETVVRRDYMTGRQDGTGGSADWLLWCLSPALVATGVQMFQYRARIFKHSAVLVGSCAVVSLLNILGTVAIAPWLGISPETSLAATMRCVTIPMGLPTYQRLCAADGIEGNVALVALSAGISGFLGFGFSKLILSSAACSAPLSQPIARGIATGTAAHALGAATFAATETEAFVWGMLAMAATGVASASWICACPPVRDLTLWLAHRNEKRDAVDLS